MYITSSLSIYLSPTAKIAVGIIVLLTIINVLLYLWGRKKALSTFFRLLNFINRIIFLGFLLFFYLHWPYKEYWLYTFYATSFLLLAIESLLVVLKKKKADSFFWIDNLFNIIVVVLILRLYVI
ncbi:MAG: hypothetical protein WD607_00660 [Candidatus Paceibacterota bacterium]